MKLNLALLALVLSFAVCASAGTAAVSVGQFDVWEETPKEEWTSYMNSLPQVQRDPVTGDFPVFNATKACNWVLYKQCDGRWGGNRIGTSGTTICKVGCAMSSVAMYLNGRGKGHNPGTLNNWLTGNGGYAQGNLIVWGAVNKLGLVYRGQQVPTVQELVNGLNGCHGIISNVNGGGHWVLLTGYAGNNVFYVNDPGYNRGTYPYHETLRHSVYH